MKLFAKICEVDYRKCVADIDMSKTQRPKRKFENKRAD